MPRKKTETSGLPYTCLADLDVKDILRQIEERVPDYSDTHFVADLQVLNDVLLYMRYAFGFQDCNLSYVNAFTTLAANKVTALADLPDLLNVSRTTITRFVAYIGEGAVDSMRPVTGLNYITSHEDPRDVRKKYISLTPAGKLVANNLLRLGRGEVTFAQLKLEQQDYADAAAKRPPK
jgi:DNA-binding MarR family transcriptional regulator